jgi:glycosyltransferase involved in cell wall biosynthesis
VKVSQKQQPLVSILTPVYNGEKYLAECIESVLNQTYQNYEYIIINNCSKDGTLAIAQEYAKKDPRIKVHDNTEFVAVIANHNIAFNLISPQAKYCKIVSGDDFVFPTCVERLVEFAEANPSAGFVNCYQLSGDHILWQGLRYPKGLISGVEMCRRVLIENNYTFGFGSPTSLLYRADLIRESKEFYPNASPHADTSACFRYLHRCDFGFVFEVLSFERTHEETQSYASAQVNRYSSAYLNDVIQYGPNYLNADELKAKIKEVLDGYYRYLAVDYFIGFRDAAFWNYHKGRLKELGYPLSRVALFKAGISALMHEIMNPVQAFRKIRKRLHPKAATAPAKPAPPKPDKSQAAAG